MQAPTQVADMFIVMFRNDWERKRADFLAAKAAIVPIHEPLSRGSRRGSNRPAKHRSHVKLRLEPSGSSGGLQRPNMHAELVRELGERNTLTLFSNRRHYFVSARD
jgi:hypothetical protein